MLGQRHLYIAMSTLREGDPVTIAWPCGQCGLPVANEIHDLPAAPPLDAREAAAGEAVQVFDGGRRRIASWSNAPGDQVITLRYHADRLALDGPVVEVDMLTPVGDATLTMPLARLEEMVAGIRRRAAGA